jgi:DNA-directed RNA polymerase omega subunit
MSYLWREELIKKTGSVYKLVTIASRRAVELGSGAQPLVETGSENKIINTALREIIEGKVTLKAKEKK